MKKRNRFLTSFLFTTPSFLSGAGTVINLAGNYYKYNTSDSGLEADFNAIRCDFGIIEQDLEAALEELKKEEDLAAA
jgi:hypothetical protein